MLNTLSSRDLISLPVSPSNVPIIIPGVNVIVSVLLTLRNRTFRVGCFLKASISSLTVSPTESHARGEALNPARSVSGVPVTAFPDSVFAAD